MPTIENRYFRSDTDAGGTLILGLASGLALTLSGVSVGDGVGCNIGIRVWKGVTEITGGAPVAVASVPTGATAYVAVTGSWACPLTALAGEHILVHVYMRTTGGAWVQIDVWETEAMADNTLDAANWIVHYYVRRMKVVFTYTYYFAYGDVNAYIQNFTHENIVSSVLRRLMVGVGL